MLLRLAPLSLLLLAAAAQAQSASRDLPSTYRPSGPEFTVAITLLGVGGVPAAGVEDKPPIGWTVSCISNSGVFDAQSGKVKWGPFFSPSIPTLLTYDIVAPVSASGEACFTGTASFGGLDQAVGGDACIPAPIPTTSALGLVMLSAFVLSMGGWILARRYRSTFDAALATKS